MRLMTMNVWSDYMDNPIAPREYGIYNAIMKYNPDIFGLQEMSINWHTSNFSKIIAEDYVCVEISCENHVPVYYKKTKFELIECGWERYNGIPRPHRDKSFTWAVVEDKETNKKIGVCNTHLWYKIGEEHDRIRDNNARQLLSKMMYIKSRYNVPVFAFGDFNCAVGSSAMDILEEHNIYTSFKLTDNHSLISTYHGYPVRGDDGKFYGQETYEDYTRSIDHVITYKDDVKITKQDVVVYPEILGATDHSPIYIDVEY